MLRLFGPDLHRRLSGDVHPGDRPDGARRRRARGAADHNGGTAEGLRVDYPAAFAVNLLGCVPLTGPLGGIGIATARLAAFVMESFCCT